jgi:hypothetical protein
MAAAQLWLLRVFALEFISDRVQQLQVTLVWPLLQGFDKRPTQRTTRLSVLECVGPVSELVGILIYCFYRFKLLKLRHSRGLCVLGP